MAHEVGHDRAVALERVCEVPDEERLGPEAHDLVRRVDRNDHDLAAALGLPGEEAVGARLAEQHAQRAQPRGPDHEHEVAIGRDEIVDDRVHLERDLAEPARRTARRQLVERERGRAAEAHAEAVGGAARGDEMRMRGERLEHDAAEIGLADRRERVGRQFGRPARLHEPEQAALPREHVRVRDVLRALAERVRDPAQPRRGAAVERPSRRALLGEPGALHHAVRALGAPVARSARR